MPNIHGRRIPASRDGLSVEAMCAHCDEKPPIQGTPTGHNAVRVKRWAQQHAQNNSHRVIVKETRTTYLNGHIRAEREAHPA